MSDKNIVIVQTKYGPVKGDKRLTALGMDYVNFQGIPYMKAPTGKLRFKSPQAPDMWNETFDATQLSPSYPMFNYFAGKLDGIEDGGRINVFTKNVNPAKLYPVMVWIHGGGFITGSGQPDLFGPDYLLQKDVILVSFNYRCGAFGFLSLNDPTLEVPGNAGLKDQVFALKWVQKNIKQFGGDPCNVTIFGDSAGGASVHYHMISNQSKGLFRRAISMSGVAFNIPWTLQPRRNWAERIARLLGYTGSNKEGDILEFLESVDHFQIIGISEKVLTPEESHREYLIYCGPTIEPYESKDTFIPKHPMLMARDAWSKDIDCIIGGCSNEGLLHAYKVNKMDDDSPIRALENPAFFVPIRELNLISNAPKANEYGLLMKKAYFGDEEPSKLNKQKYFNYAGDLNFWFGIQRAVLSRANSKGKGKTFLYRFDVQTSFNFLKKFMSCEDFPGAEHGSDCAYIFKDIFLESPPLKSVEFDNVWKMIGIFCNFSINGDTNISEWEPIKSTEIPVKCLNIENDGCRFIDLPETERLAVWNLVYQKAGVDLY